MNQPTHQADFPDPAVALVQGASRGIGLALTASLAADRRFGRILACCRNPNEAKALTELAAANSGRIVLHPLDITRERSVVDLSAMLDDNELRPSLVLNVSGLLHDGDEVQPEKRLEDLSLEQLERVFAVNALGPAILLRELLPRMAKNDKAVLAALSARVGSIGDNRLGGWYAYRSSKAALNQLLRTAAIEARRRFRNVIVAALHPGTTDTALSRPFQGNVPAGKLFSTEFVAERLLDVIGGLKPDESGNFYAWDGSQIEW